MNKSIALVAVLAVATSCSTIKEVEVTDITNVEVRQMDMKRVALRVDARIDNPNALRIEVIEPDVDLFVNDNFIGKAKLDSSLVLEKKAAQVYPIYLHTDMQGGPILLTLITGAINGQMKFKAKGTITGKSGALKKTFPFEMEQMVELGEQ